jgi:hypothetical protein
LVSWDTSPQRALSPRHETMETLLAPWGFWSYLLSRGPSGASRFTRTARTFSDPG